MKLSSTGHEPVLHFPALHLAACHAPPHQLRRSPITTTQGFGIIEGADGSKVPFIASDVKNRHGFEPGQKVIFSVRKFKDQAFAENDPFSPCNRKASAHSSSVRRLQSQLR